MRKEKYIYGEVDIKGAIEAANEDTFGWKYELTEFFIEKVLVNLKRYANLYRFYDRNCAGCVAGNDDCAFSRGEDEAKGGWEKAKNGEIFDCPVRTNGSFSFNSAEPEKGLQKIDISDRDKPPYPIVVKEEPEAK